MPRKKSNPVPLPTRLATLRKDIMSLLTLREISDDDLARYGIVREKFDIEASEASIRGVEPPILFKPLAQDVLENKHPIDLNSPYLDKREYYDYEEEWLGNHHHKTTSDGETPGQILQRATEAAEYLQRWAWRGFPRVGFPIKSDDDDGGSGEYPVMELSQLLKWSDVSGPNPLLINTQFSGCTGPGLPNWWHVQTMEREGSEPYAPTHPHLILMILQDCSGREETMLAGELFPLIEAMEARASQPKVSDEDEAERLWMDDREILEKLPPLFPKESRFPILLISLQGPQHGRVFYACMNGEKMVIRQSRLYSFEKRATAPWDLFARWMLSEPLKEPV